MIGALHSLWRIHAHEIEDSFQHGTGGFGQLESRFGDGFVSGLAGDYTALLVENVEGSGKFCGVVGQVVGHQRMRDDLNQLGKKNHLSNQCKFRRMGQE